MSVAAPQVGAPESPQPVRGIDGFFTRHELGIVVLLCFLAGIRVFVFCLAFPPFGTTDEIPHYSLVCDYADGHIPTCLETYNIEASSVVGYYCSPEYLMDQKAIESGERAIPLTKTPSPAGRMLADVRTMAYMGKTNQESTQWPLYYATAAGWYRLGAVVGFADVRLAYWIRLLNVIVYGLLIWTAYALLRRLYPASPLVCIGVPLLLAFFPQDLFYFIGNDVLTALLYTIAFYSLLRLYPQGNTSLGLFAVAGLSAAGVLLAKLTNVTVVLPLAVTVIAVVRKARADGKLKKMLPGIGLALSVAIVPFALWLVRNYLVIGDATATLDRAHFLTWTQKPFAQWFHHPVFSLAGAWTFLSELTDTFWRGEVLWHEKHMAMPAADLFYTISSLIFVGGAVAAFLWRRDRRPAGERYAGWLSIAVLAASVMLMLVGSIAFDFGACYYPSTQHPFLTSGRLMCGAMVPFLVLYITGLDFLLTRARLRVSRFGMLMIFAALITVSEIVISVPVFASPWNWFHL